MDLWGFSVFLLARESLVLKGGGVFGMVMGSYMFFAEFNDPAHWVQRDFLTLSMIFMNVFFLIVFTERLKQKR